MDQPPTFAGRRLSLRIEPRLMPPRGILPRCRLPDDLDSTAGARAAPPQGRGGTPSG